METVEPFADNWAYLRTELNWLDRVLGIAIARQRKEVKDVERVARSQVDKATSHWWRGLISVEGEVAGDSPADTSRRRSTGKTSYQQQMEARIQASASKGIPLALPFLCQKLHLTPFEKNMVLMALAPEISRRYGRLYNYLKDTDQVGGGLPTFDLILRLLCQNDGEWRSARLSLSQTSPLVRSGLVLLPSQSTEPFLTLPIKLANPIVEYLLADQPQPEHLEWLLQSSFNFLSDNHKSDESHELSALSDWQPGSSTIQSGYTQPSYLQSWLATGIDRWSNLVLPTPLMECLRHLCDRVQYGNEVDQDWGFGEVGLPPGSILWFTGAKGTGKTMAAQAIAQTLQTPLIWVDLALVQRAECDRLLQEIAAQVPKVLLLKSADLWFGPSTPVPVEMLHQFLANRLQQHSLTILTNIQPQSPGSRWENHLSQMLNFPIPDEPARLKLWRQAFPSQVPLAKLQWAKLARIVLTGGDIQAIARDAAIIARAASTAPKVTMKHLVQACEMKGIKVDGEYGN
jgi:hypothetical protein